MTEKESKPDYVVPKVDSLSLCSKDCIGAGWDSKGIYKKVYREGSREKIIVEKEFKESMGLDRIVEESERVWKRLKDDGLRVPEFYFSKKKNGTTVALMEYLGEPEVQLFNFRKEELSKIAEKIDNFSELIEKAVTDLAHIHSLGIGLTKGGSFVDHPILSIWFVKVNNSKRKGELIIGDITNLSFKKMDKKNSESEELLNDLENSHQLFCLDRGTVEYYKKFRKLYRDTYRKFMASSDVLKVKFPGQKVRY